MTTNRSLQKKPIFAYVIDDFYVGEILAIGAYFILTFYNKHTLTTQYEMCFASTFFIELHDCCVPFATSTFWRFVSVRVMGTESIVCSCTGFNRTAIAEESFHVRRVKDNTIQ